jgi:ABC-type transporter Mla maintaining outer membrane lipid asymmetry ATPase subunit MlaF
MLHEKKIYASAPPEEFFNSSDAVVRQFVDGVADAKETIL